jgi:hypothetical protein
MTALVHPAPETPRTRSVKGVVFVIRLLGLLERPRGIHAGEDHHVDGDHADRGARRGQRGLGRHRASVLDQPPSQTGRPICGVLADALIARIC